MSDRRGFTLIELSIVLVIIGLIVGGILTGQELIYAARLRKVGTELQQYQTAVVTFRVKYNSLPGDFSQATNYWGTDSTCATGGGGTTGTCNGNGDGVINGWWSYGYPVESLEAWQQLGLADLVAGSYPGGQEQSIPILHPGSAWDIPTSAYSTNIAYDLFTLVPSLGEDSGFMPGDTVFQIGGQDTTYPDFTGGSGFTAPDAQALDRKIDDGNPASGNLVGMDPQHASPSNPNTTCLTGSAYSTSIATGCVLFFNLKI